MSARGAVVIFGFVLTTVKQPAGAPWIDGCRGTNADGRSWRGYAIHLSPWRKDRYGDRLSGDAACLGKLDANGKPD